MRLQARGTLHPLSQRTQFQQAGGQAALVHQVGLPLMRPELSPAMGKGMVGRASETGQRWTCPHQKSYQDGGEG